MTLNEVYLYFTLIKLWNLNDNFFFLKFCIGKFPPFRKFLPLHFAILHHFLIITQNDFSE